jgi:predicted Zn-ribbon and HTH transcriptional regulator
MDEFDINEKEDDTYEADEEFARWLQECDHPRSINEVKRMDTAQSRYGIVNELSEKKASLMQKKQQIKDNLEQIELNYKRMGEDLELQKKKGKENLTALDEQIKNYDEAIAAIKTISKEEKEKSV